MKQVDVGVDFSPRLANRNEKQGDGKYTAIDFRNKYLSELDGQEAWKNSDLFITLDFKNVRKLGPSFANEAFAYFTKYEESIEKIKSKIRIINATRIQMMIVEEELESGRSGN